MPHAEISKILRVSEGTSTFEALLRESATAKLSGRISEKPCFLTRAEMDEFDDNEIARLLRLKALRATAAWLFREFPARVSSPAAR